jgi:hypothetical protein
LTNNQSNIDFFVYSKYFKKVEFKFSIKNYSEYWSSFYNERNLIALAVQPNLISPTHYFGEPNYVSDTEQTNLLRESSKNLNDKLNSNLQTNEGSNSEATKRTHINKIEL